MSRRPQLAPIAVLGAIAAVLVLAACGGSSSPSPKSAAAKAADNALSFSKCMREHGVKDFPNPEISGGRVSLRVKAGGPGGLDVSPQTMEAAQNACKRFQPAEQTNLSPQEKVERQEAVLKFAKCMREHGIDVHASTAGGGVQIQIHPGGAGAGPNPDSPSFQDAQKACQGLLPGPKGGGGPGTNSVKGGGGGGAGFATGG
ncbi:MAG: hypothetical protein ACLQBY_01400 [Solirubrobacteraceae bacterium]